MVTLCLKFLLCPQGESTAAISIWVCAFVAHPPWCGRQSPFHLEVQGQNSGNTVRAFCMREVCLFHMTCIPSEKVVKRNCSLSVVFLQYSCCLHSLCMSLLCFILQLCPIFSSQLFHLFTPLSFIGLSTEIKKTF